ncbi:MAG: hypothetical protein ABI885_03995, partial [Gammaproteobacteria bacterium]
MTTQEESAVGKVGATSFMNWLVDTRGLTPILSERVVRVHSESTDRLAGILLKLGLLSEPALAESLAGFCSLDRLVPASIPLAPVALGAINGEFLRAREIVPLRLSDDAVEI